jgi:hypothetical protein
MKYAILVVLLSATIPALADDKPAAEPADLVKARQDYEAQIKAAVDPITATYLKKLDAMMKAFGAAGDLDAASIVREEIRAIKARTSPVTIVGKWNWHVNDLIEFRPDGTVINLRNNDRGHWRCTDAKERKYHVLWRSGGFDNVVISADGLSLSAKNNGGDSFSAKKIVP